MGKSLYNTDIFYQQEPIERRLERIVRLYLEKVDKMGRDERTVLIEAIKKLIPPEVRCQVHVDAEDLVNWATGLPKPERKEEE